MDLKPGVVERHMVISTASLTSTELTSMVGPSFLATVLLTKLLTIVGYPNLTLTLTLTLCTRNHGAAVTRPARYRQVPSLTSVAARRLGEER